jgi:hypothetical protein
MYVRVGLEPRRSRSLTPQIEPAVVREVGTDSPSAAAVAGVIDHFQLDLAPGIGEEADRADDAARTPTVEGPAKAEPGQLPGQRPADCGRSRRSHTKPQVGAARVEHAGGISDEISRGRRPDGICARRPSAAEAAEQEPCDPGRAHHPCREHPHIIHPSSSCMRTPSRRTRDPQATRARATLTPPQQEVVVG